MVRTWLLMRENRGNVADVGRFWVLQTLGARCKSGGFGRYKHQGQGVSRAVLGATNTRGKE